VQLTGDTFYISKLNEYIRCCLHKCMCMQSAFQSSQPRKQVRLHVFVSRRIAPFRLLTPDGSIRQQIDYLRTKVDTHCSREVPFQGRRLGLR
jgi:hypothetical protein